MADVRKKKETISLDEVEEQSHKNDDEDTEVEAEELPDVSIKVIGKIDLQAINSKTRPDKKPYTPEPKKVEEKAVEVPVQIVEPVKEEKIEQVIPVVQAPVVEVSVTETPIVQAPIVAEKVIEEVEIPQKPVRKEEELYTPDRTPIDSTVKVIG